MKIHIVIFSFFIFANILFAKIDTGKVVYNKTISVCKYFNQDSIKLKQIDNDIALLKTNILKSRWDKIWDGFCNTLGAIIFAFINLLILIYQLGKNRKKEKQNIENEKKSYWYRKIILENNIESLCDYFKEANVFYHQNKNNPTDIIYGELRKKYLDKRSQYNRMSLLLGIFENIKFVEDLNNLILEHENLIFSDDVDAKYFLNKNIEIEKKVMQILYLYDYSNYKNT